MKSSLVDCLPRRSPLPWQHGHPRPQHSGPSRNNYVCMPRHIGLRCLVESQLLRGISSNSSSCCSSNHGGSRTARTRLAHLYKAWRLFLVLAVAAAAASESESESPGAVAAELAAFAAEEKELPQKPLNWEELSVAEQQISLAFQASTMQHPQQQGKQRRPAVLLALFLFGHVFALSVSVCFVSFNLHLAGGEESLLLPGSPIKSPVRALTLGLRAPQRTLEAPPCFTFPLLPSSFACCLCIGLPFFLPEPDLVEKRDDTTESEGPSEPHGHPEGKEPRQPQGPAESKEAPQGQSDLKDFDRLLATEPGLSLGSAVTPGLPEQPVEHSPLAPDKSTTPGSAAAAGVRSDPAGDLDVDPNSDAEPPATPAGSSAGLERLGKFEEGASRLTRPLTLPPIQEEETKQEFQTPGEETPAFQGLEPENMHVAESETSSSQISDGEEVEEAGKAPKGEILEEEDTSYWSPGKEEEALASWLMRGLDAMMKKGRSRATFRVKSKMWIIASVEFDDTSEDISEDEQKRKVHEALLRSDTEELLAWTFGAALRSIEPQVVRLGDFPYVSFSMCVRFFPQPALVCLGSFLCGHPEGELEERAVPIVTLAAAALASCWDGFACVRAAAFGSFEARRSERGAAYGHDCNCVHC
ncbi:hypothetical protein Efla_007781 [Eimeria flavescens]